MSRYPSLSGVILPLAAGILLGHYVVAPWLASTIALRILSVV